LLQHRLQKAIVIYVRCLISLNGVWSQLNKMICHLLKKFVRNISLSDLWLIYFIVLGDFTIDEGSGDLPADFNAFYTGY